MIDLDVIIPTYNAKYTIEQTLASLASQTEARHLKVYIANDASDYDYKFWIDRYKPAFKVLEEIRSEVNVGPGYIRQYAFDRTSGKYVLYIDSDDTLDNSYSIFHLSKAIEKNPMLDIVYGDGIEELQSIYFPDNTGQKLSVQSGLFLHLHGKVYRRKYIEDYNIRFYKTMTHEDICFNIIAFSLTDKVQHVNELVFNHHYRGTSITRSWAQLSANTDGVSDQNQQAIFDNYKMVKDHIYKYNNGQYSRAACEHIMWEMSTLYLKYDLYQYVEDQTRAKWFTNNLKEFYDNIFLPIFDTPYAEDFRKFIAEQDHPYGYRWNYFRNGAQCRLTFAEFTDMLDNYKIKE